MKSLSEYVLEALSLEEKEFNSFFRKDKKSIENVRNLYSDSEDSKLWLYGPYGPCFNFDIKKNNFTGLFTVIPNKKKDKYIFMRKKFLANDEFNAPYMEMTASELRQLDKIIQDNTKEIDDDEPFTILASQVGDDNLRYSFLCIYLINKDKVIPIEYNENTYDGKTEQTKTNKSKNDKALKLLKDNSDLLKNVNAILSAMNKKHKNV